MTQLSDYQDSDLYKPAIIKDHLQQWDNYQIYSLYCVDRIYVATGTKTYYTGVAFSPFDGSPNDTSKIFNDFVAVQEFSPYRKIPCNFRAIAIAYPG
jgi:hypothetical protein